MTVVAVIAVLGVLLGASIRRYATLAVVASMVVQVLASLAFLRFESATQAPPHGFRLGPLSRTVVGSALILCSLGLAILAVIDSPATSLAFLALIGAGAGYYVLRRRALGRRGIRIEDALRKLSESRDEPAGRP